MKIINILVLTKQIQIFTRIQINLDLFKNILLTSLIIPWIRTVQFKLKTIRQIIINETINIEVSSKELSHAGE